MNWSPTNAATTGLIHFYFQKKKKKRERGGGGERRHRERRIEVDIESRISPVPRATNARPMAIPHGWGGVPVNPGMAVNERTMLPAQYIFCINEKWK